MDKKTLSHDNFIKRLSDAAEQKLGISQHDRGFKRELAKALKTRDSTIQRWFGKSFPEAEYLLKIYNFLGITSDFLLGIEDKSKSRPERLPVPILELADFVEVKEPIKRNDFITVPLVSGRIAAGRGIIVDENVEDWVITHKNVTGQRKNLISIRIDEKEGMSMYPILSPGDIIIINRDDISITPKGIYAVRIDDYCTIKRLQQSDDQLLLIPENTAEYKTQIIDLRTNPKPIIGKVIWCSKTL
jgi:SOS-response transcriptional repressor LexA